MAGNLLTMVVFLTGAFMLVVAFTTAVWQTHVFSDEAKLKQSYWPTSDPVGETFRILVVVPAVDEVEEVLLATVKSLVQQTLAPIRVVMTIPAWDEVTLGNAARVADRFADSPVTVDVMPYYGNRKNKPSQLQAVFESLLRSGDSPDAVGIFDAETIASSRLLEVVDRRFRTDPQPIAVQGSIQLMNVNDSWVSLRCALEYLWWFRSRLHRAVQMGVVPLGGNTVFFRFSYLREIGGWNVENLAEDAEIGIRVSALGPGSIAVGYDPLISSREEAPLTVTAMVKQRTRWNLGFLQTLQLQTWKAYSSPRQRAIAWTTLNMPRTQLFTGFAFAVTGVSLMMVLFTSWSPPMYVALFSVLPFLAYVLVLALDVVALRHLGQEYSIRIKPKTYALLLLTTPLYQLAQSWAAVRAEWKFWHRDFAWSKTAHVGRHLVEEGSA